MSRGAVVTGLLLSCYVCLAAENRYEVQGPIELHVYVTVREGMGRSLERVYASEYYPAIIRQAGFRHSSLLKAAGSEDQYVLRLAFDSEDLRIRWAQSETHQKVWPNMQANFAESRVTAFSILPPPGRLRFGGR